MPFIGNQPALSYTSFAKQDFTTSATTSYTLDQPVTNENEIALFINFVRQEPTTAYTASGTSLTLTSATSASDDMYCVFLGKAVQTVNPPNGSVGLSQLSATGTKDATTFLRGDNTFASAGGTNTPAFEAVLNAGQTASDAVETKIQFGREIYDTDSCYDNVTNYRFTPTTAGKYFVYVNLYGGVAAVSRLSQIACQIRKNGTTVADSGIDNRSDGFGLNSYIFVGATIDFNGTTDYVEGFGYINDNGGSNVEFYGDATSSRCRFGAYKIIE